jgi:hypothetical protein
MAQPPAPPPPLTAWELFEELGAELQLAMLELIGAAGATGLRGACVAARALVNSRVEGIRLGVDDLGRAPLGLHGRFPRLTRLELESAPDGEPLSSDTFAEFALDELQSLASLIELDLRGCKALGTAAVLALRNCCPQLQHLDLEDTGASCGFSQACTRCGVARLKLPCKCLCGSHSAPVPQLWEPPPRCRRWRPSPASQG